MPHTTKCHKQLDQEKWPVYWHARKMVLSNLFKTLEHWKADPVFFPRLEKRKFLKMKNILKVNFHHFYLTN